jgi:hypothetical protein
MWAEVGASSRPQSFTSSILMSPMSPVATKSTGAEVFSLAVRSG